MSKKVLTVFYENDRKKFENKNSENVRKIGYFFTPTIGNTKQKGLHLKMIGQLFNNFGLIGTLN